MKRTLAISLIALGLAACQQQAKVPEAAPSAEGTAKVGAPAAALAVTGGTLVLPAVKGNPGAAYFDLANGTAKPATLAAVTIAGAEKAEMHQTTGGSMAPVDTVEVKAGETVKFERGGRHVMIFGLADSVQAGGSFLAWRKMPLIVVIVAAAVVTALLRVAGIN